MENYYFSSLYLFPVIVLHGSEDVYTFVLCNYI